MSEERHLRRDMGMLGLLFASVGSIIGSGWLFGAKNAALQAGPAAMISWAIGAVLILLIALVYAELGTMFPISGGVVRFPHFAFGSFASYSFGWLLWIACASTTAIEVEAAMQYGTVHVPGLMKVVGGETPVLTFPEGFLVAVASLAVLTIVNMYGIRWFARINNALVWWKLVIIVLVIVMFLVTAFHVANFSLSSSDIAGPAGFAPFGAHGVATAVATAGVIFSYLGFRQGIELAGETDNPHRNVPIAVIGSVVLTAIIYIGLQIAFIGSLGPSALTDGWANLQLANDFGPLAAVAGVLGLSWLATLLYIDAVVSPADTGLIYAAVTSRVSYAVARNRNAPESLAKLNRRGVPWISLVLTFLAGVVFLLPFPGWQKLVGFVTSATVLSFGSAPLVLGALRRELPDFPRSFRLPFGDAIPYLAFFASNLIIFWSGWETDWKLFVGLAIGYVVFAATQPFIKDGPKLNLKASSWFIPYILGLVVIIYVSDFPAKSDGAGNLGWIGLWWGLLVVAAWSAVIYAWAIKVRLRRPEVERSLREGLKGEEEDLVPAAGE
ncbi:MAG: APC family permease [Nocardioidaceae bacterium]